SSASATSGPHVRHSPAGIESNRHLNGPCFQNLRHQKAYSPSAGMATRQDAVTGVAPPLPVALSHSPPESSSFASGGSVRAPNGLFFGKVEAAADSPSNQT